MKGQGSLCWKLGRHCHFGSNGLIYIFSFILLYTFLFCCCCCCFCLVLLEETVLFLFLFYFSFLFFHFFFYVLFFTSIYLLFLIGGDGPPYSSLTTKYEFIQLHERDISLKSPQPRLKPCCSVFHVLQYFKKLY